VSVPGRLGGGHLDQAAPDTPDVTRPAVVLTSQHLQQHAWLSSLTSASHLNLLYCIVLYSSVLYKNVQLNFVKANFIKTNNSLRRSTISVLNRVFLNLTKVQLVKSKYLC